MYRALLPWCCLVCLLAACGNPPAPTRGELLTQAQNAKPGDDRIAALYAQSCRTCHVNEGSGAPLTHDRSAWDARWEKGLPALMQNVVLGMNGMPAGGQCFACTPRDFESLIAFLAGRAD